MRNDEWRKRATIFKKNNPRRPATPCWRRVLGRTRTTCPGRPPPAGPLGPRLLRTRMRLRPSSRRRTPPRTLRGTIALRLRLRGGSRGRRGCGGPTWRFFKRGLFNGKTDKRPKKQTVLSCINKYGFFRQCQELAYHSCLEMHQSLMFSSQCLKTLALEGGLKVRRPSSDACRALAAMSPQLDKNMTMAQIAS